MTATASPEDRSDRSGNSQPAQITQAVLVANSGANTFPACQHHTSVTPTPIRITYITCSLRDANQ